MLLDRYHSALLKQKAEDATDISQSFTYLRTT